MSDKSRKLKLTFFFLESKPRKFIMPNKIPKAKRASGKLLTSLAKGK
jgi:hypothetical protein